MDIQLVKQRIAVLACVSLEAIQLIREQSVISPLRLKL